MGQGPSRPRPVGDCAALPGLLLSLLLPGKRSLPHLERPAGARRRGIRSLRGLLFQVPCPRQPGPALRELFLHCPEPGGRHSVQRQRGGFLRRVRLRGARPEHGPGDPRRRTLGVAHCRLGRPAGYGPRCGRLPGGIRLVQDGGGKPGRDLRRGQHGPPPQRQEERLL